MWLRDDEHSVIDIQSPVFNFDTQPIEDWTFSESSTLDQQPCLKQLSNQQTVHFYDGHGYFNSYSASLGDAAMGVYQSANFMITSPRICLLAAGGRDEEKLRISLIIDGTEERVATGSGSESFGRQCWDTERWLAKSARIRISDMSQEPWGHIMVDSIAQYTSARN
jgi:hypothetical protein